MAPWTRLKVQAQSKAGWADGLDMVLPGETAMKIGVVDGETVDLDRIDCAVLDDDLGAHMRRVSTYLRGKPLVSQIKLYQRFPKKFRNFNEKRQ